MGTFIAHSSVRVQGTEDVYEPAFCGNDECPNEGAHLHCPFCPPEHLFRDEKLTRLHYGVKHVDKAISYAGLKILRCSNTCPIYGTMKSQKHFKGCHWHCYSCRNGFSRRDEALKHYRTHFKHKDTTFQIQVTTDVNHSVPVSLPTQVPVQDTSCVDYYPPTDQTTIAVMEYPVEGSLRDVDNVPPVPECTVDVTTECNEKNKLFTKSLFSVTTLTDESSSELIHSSITNNEELIKMRADLQTALVEKATMERELNAQIRKLQDELREKSNTIKLLEATIKEQRENRQELNAFDLSDVPPHLRNVLKGLQNDHTNLLINQCRTLRHAKESSTDSQTAAGRVDDTAIVSFKRARNI